MSNYDWLTEWYAKEKGYFKPIGEMILKYVEISWNREKRIGVFKDP